MSEQTATPEPPKPATGTENPEVKPTETVDFWKSQARENERRAKDNAQKAKDYDAYVESQKTEQQKLADQVSAAQGELEAARTEAMRYRIAAKHGIGEDDFDLLGSGTEEQIEARATRIASLNQGKSASQPVKPDPHQGVRPGTGSATEAGKAEARRRFGETANRQ